MADKSTTSNDQFNRIEHAWNIYLNTQEIIKYADQKVHVLLVFTTIVAASVIVKFDYIVKQGFFNELLAIAFLIVTGFFLMFALLALLARYDIKGEAIGPRQVFFRHIQERNSAREYANSFKEVSCQDALDDLCNQIYEVSVITESKFRNYRLACITLIIQIVLFLIIFIGLAM